MNWRRCIRKKCILFFRKGEPNTVCRVCFRITFVYYSGRSSFARKKIERRKRWKYSTHKNEKARRTNWQLNLTQFVFVGYFFGGRRGRPELDPKTKDIYTTKWGIPSHSIKKTFRRCALPQKRILYFFENMFYFRTFWVGPPPLCHFPDESSGIISIYFSKKRRIPHVPFFCPVTPHFSWGKKKKEWDYYMFFSLARSSS